VSKTYELLYEEIETKAIFRANEYSDKKKKEMVALFNGLIDKKMKNRIEKLLYLSYKDAYLSAYFEAINEITNIEK
jgi:hypothetical protein